MCSYRQGKFACASHAFFVKKKSCRVVLDSTAESRDLSLCLGESMLCAKKEPILPLDGTGMVFLKVGIGMATELM